MPMTSPASVIFDFFGTLTPALTSPTDYVSVAAVFGLPVAAFQQVMRDSSVDRASGRYGGQSATLRWVASRLGKHPTDTQLEDACALRIASVRRDAALRPDAVSTLKTLKDAGVYIGLVSDCTHELPAIWPTIDVAAYVDVAVFSVEVGACKPDPLPYITACRRLAVAPENCWYVGDGGSQELTGSKALGMTAIQLVESDSHAHRASRQEPDWTGPQLSSLSELVDLYRKTEQVGCV
jgi:putative hydrolase of the HAD superfamily